MKRIWFNWIGWLVAVMVCAGCSSSGGGGGGGLGDLPGSPSDDVADTNPQRATAEFRVDVRTRRVEVVPLGGEASRAVFGGSVVGLESSLLFDQPGNTGLKVLDVSLLNQSGLTIGRMPGGAVNGVRVVFGPFRTNSDIPELRSQTTVTTYAGSGSSGALDGPANAATFSGPACTAVGSDGRVYVTDFVGCRIRCIANDEVTTLAGSGALLSATGGGAGASLNQPCGIAWSSADNSLVVAEYNGNRISRVTPDGRVTWIAGTGTAGTADGTGDVAQFKIPYGVAVDSEGRIYVSEIGSHRIRRIDLVGLDPTKPVSYNVTTLAGGPSSGFADGSALSARFNAPTGLACDANGSVYVADSANNRLRRISPTGEVVTIAGTGVAGAADGKGNVATLRSPFGVTCTNLGVVFSDRTNRLLRVCSLTSGGASSAASGWTVQRLAGASAANQPGSNGSTDGTGDVARFGDPLGLSSDANGTVFVADATNQKVRRVVPPASFVLGSGGGSPSAEPVRIWNPDGLAAGTGFGTACPYVLYREAIEHGASSSPKQWWFSVPEGVEAFQFQVLVEACTEGPATAAAGTPSQGSVNAYLRTLAGGSSKGYVDGIAAQARFDGIAAMAADAAGNLFVADAANNAIRRVTADGLTTTLAGQPGAPAAVPAPGSTCAGGDARLNSACGIAVSPDGETVYIADTGNHTLRLATLLEGADPRIAGSWTISVIAGATSAGESDGSGDVARFNQPRGLGVDDVGALYVTDATGGTVRKVRFRGGDATLPVNWQVTTLATGLSAPTGLALDRQGNLYFGNSAGGSIKKLTPDRVLSDFATANQVYGVTVDLAGYVYSVSLGSHYVGRFTPTGAGPLMLATHTLNNPVDGAGNVADVADPLALASDTAGRLYVAEGPDLAPGKAYRIRVIERIIESGVPALGDLWTGS